MIKKYRVFIIVILLCISSTIIINKDLNVEANTDMDYIYSRTENLSNVIFIAEDHYGIKKGRAFGTPGEWWSADYIKKEMINLSLYDASENNSYPYLENISDYPNETIDDKLEILGRGLKINGTEFITDCFISPQWNNSWWDLIREMRKKPPIYDKDDLTHNFSNTDLKIYRQPDPKWYFDVLNNQTLIELILNNISIINLSGLLNFLIPIFENKYGFKFGELNETNAPSKIPWYNDTYASICGSPYVFINETPSFNPNANIPLWKNLTPPWSKIGRLFSAGKLILLKFFGSFCNCTGLILYDSNNHTYGMYHDNLHPIPTININRTLGEQISQNTSNYNITYWINQSWNKEIESYNVIGQINGTDPDKTIIISSLMDSWWCQGTADSAIGVGIVLALAKYMKELNTTYGIQPKYNIKFILFGGEEYGFSGAYSYDREHDSEKILAVIDVNQVGFTQTKPRQTLNIITNKWYLKHLTKEIGGRTNYTERTGDVTDFETWRIPRGAPSNDEPFAINRIFRKLFPPRPSCRTMCFLKDYGWKKNWRWKLHHRDGENHTQGDTIDYYNHTDVNLTAEMVWNVTKFFAYNTDVWFEGEPTFTKYDTNNDNYYDTLNVSYNINTSWPSDHVSVRLVLYPKFQWRHPGLPILYRLREEKEYILTNNGTSDYINVTLPDCYPKGEYVAKLYICNSWGDANLDTIHLIGLETLISGLEMIEHIEDVLGIKLIEVLYPIVGKIWVALGIDIIDWIKRLPNLRNKRVRDILIDVLGYNIFRNDSRNYSDFEMHPPNNPPNPPDTPEELSKFLGFNRYKTKTTDPDPNDKIRFQWNWSGRKGIWSIFPYNQGQYHVKSHKWLMNGTYHVRARAKDIHGMMNNWSSVLRVKIGNTQPNPPVIEGPSRGTARKKYEYTFKATDPECNDKLYLYVDWDDGDYEEWIGPYDSGEKINLSHTWEKMGRYTIKAKAKDIMNAESPWGELTVTMPRNKATTNSLLLWFLERFPLLERLLNLL